MSKNNYLNSIPTVIDLFCGCGGLSLGFEKAGFSIAAALDSDPQSIKTYEDNRLKQPAGIAIRKNLTEFLPDSLKECIGITHVDVILGGPPCQGFSSVRQVDGANSGKRLVDDPRRNLYQHYLDYIKAFKPVFFLMENVLGLKTMNKGEWWTRIRHDARSLGYRLCPLEILASDYGVPQNRRRLFIVGTRKDSPVLFHKSCITPTHSKKKRTLWEAIGDLPSLKAGEGKSPVSYNQSKIAEHIRQYGNEYLYNVLEVDKSDQLTGHIARPHNPRDLRDFKKIREGETSHGALQRGETLEFPYNREIFKDRFTRLHRQEPCSTILAHLAKDGLMFIHPTQQRSLTVREAARIQSFPDWFVFPEARTHAYRMIGNAVPPLLGLIFGKALFDLLQKYERQKKHTGRKKRLTICNATRHMAKFSANKPDITVISNNDFLLLWKSIFSLIQELHPDEALDHGDETEVVEISGLEPSQGMEAYKRSGWPIEWVPIATEARKRYQEKHISLSEYYLLDE
jgi:DNA (cytosine-5)-methyltransferase 1